MSRTANMTTHDALFKEFYGSGADQSLVNKKTPLASILMKNKNADFVGDQFVQPVRFGSAVGLGYRSSGQNLPEPVASPRGKAVFGAKRAYAATEFDREAIIASRNDRGSFAKITVDEVNATEEGFMLHMIERALFSDSSGKLGEVSSLTGAGTSGSPWVLTMATTGTNAPVHKKRYYPRGAKIDVYSSGGVLQMTIQVVSASSTTVTAVTVSMAADNTPAATDILYWEGNKDGECVGLGLIAPVSAGTLYGISQTTNPEFRGLLKNVGATIAYSDLNSIVSSLEDEIDSPNLAVGSHATIAALKSQAEDQKRYNMSEVKSADSKIGFKGIELMSGDGAFPMIASQMCQDSDLWFINTAYLQLVMRQDFGWFDWNSASQGGEAYLRADDDKDIMKARYGGYFELFCSKPNSIARVYNFSV